MIPYFSADEIADRRPVWAALSDLYLDTDSRFSLDELHSILLEEIAPVLEGNLLQVAGEWAGFDEEWLVREVLGRQGSNRRVWLLVDIEQDWQCVAGLARILRGLPPESRRIRWRAWHALIPLFVDKVYRPGGFPAPAELMLPELDRIFRNDLAPLPIVYGGSPNTEEIEANWRVFAAMIHPAEGRSPSA